MGRLKDFLSNDRRFRPESPEYRKAFLLNAMLLTLIFICLLFTVFNIIDPCNPRAVYINVFSAVAALFVLVYFHKTDSLKISIPFTLGLLLLTLISFFMLVGNQNYSFYWLAVMPPAVYFLLDRKTARITAILFCAYMLYFMLANMGDWAPDKFTLNSLVNISGATLALLLMMGYFETSIAQVTAAFHRTNAELEDSEDELRLLLDSAAEGIYGIDTKGNCTFCNERALELLGYSSAAELVGKNMHSLIQHSRRDGSKLPAESCGVQKATLAGEKIHREDGVFWRKDGSCFDVEFFSYPKYKNSSVTGAVVTFMDISQRRAAEERIRYLRCHDHLTGLKNRQCFEEELIKYGDEKHLPLSIVYGDLNSLKLTNDIFGHEAGDVLIKKSAEVLKKVCRKCDLAARVGGDEFVLLLSRTGAEKALEIIARIKTEMSLERVEAIRCSIALGLDTRISIGQELEQVIKNAENEMYREKTVSAKSMGVKTIKDLISSLHESFPNEKSHSIAISSLCGKMGKALGWADCAVKKLQDAGYYHDIGKIALRSSLLIKTEALTSLEAMEKRQHSVLGYRILCLFDNTLDLAETVYYHHEKWDGSGYPKGLKAEEIPVNSRIIAIAEHYDYLRNRLNPAPLDKQSALFRIAELSGISFDPALARVFIEPANSSPDI